MTQREIVEAQSQFVVMRNELIQKSRYSLSLTEQKLVLYMVSKITPFDEPYKEYIFSYDEFEAVCNLNRDGGKSKILVVEALKALKSKTLEIRLSEKQRVITSWFNDAVIDEETQEIRIGFSKYLTPYLYNLQTFYTKFCLENTLAMSSKYGIRLYEYLISIRSKGHKQKISLEELRERIGCDKYEKYKDFRVRVLEPALKDINVYTDISVEYKEVKTGRKVTYIEFVIVASDTAQRHINRARALGRM